MRQPFCLILAFDDETRHRFVMVRNKRRGWELPGGVVDAGESGVQAAAREFQEETGRLLRDPLPFALPPEAPWHHVVSGYLGDDVPNSRQDGSIVEWRLVEWMDDVAPLAFPDDPYELLAEGAGRPLRPPRSLRGSPATD